MIGNKPATYRSPLCHYCGNATTDQSVAVGGYAVVVCDACDTRNIFSDVYKDRVGIRPRGGWTLPQMREFLRAERREVEA